MAKPKFKAALPLSYVAQGPNSVRVQLQLDDSSGLVADSTYLRLRGAGQPIRTAAVRLEMSTDSDIATAEVPSDRLSNGSWCIEVSNDPNGPFSAVPAFVVISVPNPIALLLGRPESMDQRGPTAGPPPSTTARIVRRVGSMVDRAVAELPPSTARKSRVRLRKLARRLPR